MEEEEEKAEEKAIVRSAPDGSDNKPKEKDNERTEEKGKKKTNGIKSPTQSNRCNQCNYSHKTHIYFMKSTFTITLDKITMQLVISKFPKTLL